MNIKKLLKPSVLKIIIFLFIGLVYLYFARESTCGASFFFAFCYNAYGFPFFYMMDGNIDAALDYAKGILLGEYFSKYGNSLFNPAAFVLDIVLIYLLACFISVSFEDIMVKPDVKHKNLK